MPSSPRGIQCPVPTLTARCRRTVCSSQVATAERNLAQIQAMKRNLERIEMETLRALRSLPY